MKQTLTIHPFSIHMEQANPQNQAFCESIFSQGNGYMGIRGFDPLGAKPDDHTRSVFLAGCFEYIKPGITDMVNTPDVFSARLENDAIEIKASLTLDMQTGLWQRDSVWETKDGKQLHIVTQRIVSMAQKHAAALRITITAPEDTEISLVKGLDDAVANLPVSDDQMTKNAQVHRLLVTTCQGADSEGGILCMETVPSGRKLFEAYRIRTNGTASAAEGAYTRITARGQLTLEKFCAVYTGRDGAGDLLPLAQACCAENAAKGFDAVFQESAEAWARLWAASDIRLDADDALQGALRYNIFQLLQNNASDDPHASIGARGLMHGRYKGNYFWDTELFMLPFYLYTRPEAAKNLLLYRYYTLADAIEGAKNFGLRGARYPWMCSDTGFEQCETWDTGCCEVHITADIAHAVRWYVDVTGDQAFFENEGANMLLQTARYWQSRLTYCEKDDCYNLLFVKGPDEYCGVTSNNTYTNYLVRENLRAAISAGETLHHDFPGEERQKWAETASKITILYDEQRRLFIEDDLFEKLEPLDIAAHKQGDAALYRHMSYDRLQRYQVLKQADLVLLMTLFPAAFTKEQQENVYAYYEPKTLHDSTLSFGTHAQLAAKLNKLHDAQRYFEKSVFLDLHDVMENTAGEGIHMAALGASWQAVIFGFLGLSIENGAPKLSPHLPGNIQGIHTRVLIQGKPYQLDVTPGSARVTPL